MEEKKDYKLYLDTATLAGKLMHHKDKEVRSLAAIALANRRK